MKFEKKIILRHLKTGETRGARVLRKGCYLQWVELIKFKIFTTFKESKVGSWQFSAPVSNS